MALRRPVEARSRRSLTSTNGGRSTSVPPIMWMRSFIRVRSALASSKSGFSRIASCNKRSTRGMRLCSSDSVKRLAMSMFSQPALNAEHLNRERPAARTVEFGQDDTLPCTQQHHRVADLQTEALTHNHAAQVRIGVLA